MDLYSLHGFEFGFGLEMINRLGLEFCFCLGVDWMLDFTLYLDLDWGLDFSYKWTRIQVQESESTQLIMATLWDPPVWSVPRLQGLSCRNSSERPSILTFGFFGPWRKKIAKTHQTPHQNGKLLWFRPLQTENTQ